MTYAGSADGGFYRAIDGGKSWAAFNRGLSVGGFHPIISALARFPSGKLYMGTLGNGVWWLDLTPGLDLYTWKPVNSQKLNQTVNALAIQR